MRKENDGHSSMGNLKNDEKRILKVWKIETLNSEFIKNVDCHAIRSIMDKHYSYKIDLRP